MNFEILLDNVKSKSPLIHNITNYVTVNDCANMLLACGASPIMSDAIEEAAEMTSICAGLNINIGTLNSGTIPSMIAAGKKARELGHPVLLDPVGAGATRLRTDTALKILEEVRPCIIRGNASEIKTLYMGTGTTKGVDADQNDAITENSLESAVLLAGNFARRQNATVVITGAIDIISDGRRASLVRNGHPMMSRVTGTGCMLSALMCAYAAANADDLFGASVAAVCAMGLCGEIAHSRLLPEDGNSSYRNYIIDAMYNLTGQELARGAKYENR